MHFIGLSIASVQFAVKKRLKDITNEVGGKGMLVLLPWPDNMMTSSNGNIFHVTGSLWGNSPVTQSFDDWWSTPGPIVE